MGRKCWRWILVTNEDKKKILKVKELVEEYRTVFNTVGAENIKGEVVMVRNED